MSRGIIEDLDSTDRVTFASYTPSKRKGTVNFYAGNQWEPWSPASIRDGGLGGSETALVQVATRLGIAGWKVKVYSGAEASYVGGVDVLLDLWPKIRHRVPYAELHVFYGFNVLDAVARLNPQLAAYKQALLQTVATLGGEDAGIFLRGRVGQVELAEEMMQARVLAYPTAFLETSCITAMEAQAAGLPIVTSDLGALHETAAGQMLIPWSDDEDEPANRSGQYQDRFVREVAAALTDEGWWNFQHAKALSASKSFDWSKRTAQWEKLAAAPVRRATRRKSPVAA
jgi:glycosyltransferase involved in cell wall biosynthesis